MTHNPNTLQVVKRAFALSVDAHRMADRCQDAMARLSPGMRNQLLRAVNSIALNLAEGAGHESPARTASFCTTAIGSCNEVELQLRLARALDAIPSDYEALIDEVVEIRRMTFGFRKHVLGQREQPPLAGRSRPDR
jgi:four helix bundle protein